MKFKMSIQNRIVLLSMLPSESDLNTQILTKDIIKKVELTQIEIDKIDLKFNKEQGGYSWKKTNKTDKEIDFTAKEVSLIQDQIKKMNEEEKITQQNIGICLMFKEA